MVILGVRLKMFGQVDDPLGQNGDLDFGRPGIAFNAAIFLDESGVGGAAIDIGRLEFPLVEFDLPAE